MTYVAGSSFSFDAILNFTSGAALANVNGISYWMNQNTPAGAPFVFAITARNATGSLFTDLQSPGISYPQNMTPLNFSDLGALSIDPQPTGAYFIAHITMSISGSAPAGGYTIGNTTATTPGVGGRVSFMTDNQGTTFPIASSAFTITVIAIPSPTPSPTCAPIPAGVVSWWPLEGNASDNFGPNNGTLQNNPAFVAGKVGLAMSVDGTNGIAVPTSSSLNFGPGADFSIDAWIRTSNTSRAVLTIVDKRLISGPNVIGYAVYLLQGRLGFQLANGAAQDYTSLSNALSDGQWHHVAITVTRASTTGGKAYVDGGLTATFNPTARNGDLSNTQPFLIGQYNTVPSANFIGEIDEVEIFNRAVSATDVANIYNAGSAGTCHSPPTGTPSPAPSGTPTPTPSASPSPPPLDPTPTPSASPFAPVVSTLPASDPTLTTAKLNGTVNPGGASLTAWFRWGTDSQLSTFSETPPQAASGTTQIPLDAVISNLEPTVPYYFQITARNSNGQQQFGDIKRLIILLGNTPSGDQHPEYWNMYDRLIYERADQRNLYAPLVKAKIVHESAGLGRTYDKPERGFLYEPKTVDENHVTKALNDGTLPMGLSAYVLPIPPPTPPYNRFWNEFISIPTGTTDLQMQSRTYLGGKTYGLTDPLFHPTTEFVAQYRIASSYGLSQVVYWFHHDLFSNVPPESLYDPDLIISTGVRVLDAFRNQCAASANKTTTDFEPWTPVLRAYNSGQCSTQVNAYVSAVQAAFSHTQPALAPDNFDPRGILGPHLVSRQLDQLSFPGRLTDLNPGEYEVDRLVTDFKGTGQQQLAILYFVSSTPPTAETIISIPGGLKIFTDATGQTLEWQSSLVDGTAGGGRVYLADVPGGGAPLVVAEWAAGAHGMWNYLFRWDGTTFAAVQPVESDGSQTSGLFGDNGVEVTSTGQATVGSRSAEDPLRMFNVATYTWTGQTFQWSTEETIDLGTTPTPAPINISGTISYCSNPSLNPVPGVTLTLTGDAVGSTFSDSSGNYTLSSVLSGGTYTVTPTKAALLPTSAGIDTFDVIATQRHYLTVALIPPGCRRDAADVNGDSRIDTSDVVAIQRFFIGRPFGFANVGKYKFTPADRTYTGILTDQTDQNYDTLIFGDVAPGFVHRPEGGPTQDAFEVASTVAEVALPQVTVDQSRTNFVAAVTTTTIDAKIKLVGFQGDFTFDERVITFQSEPVQKAGLTGGN